ncbi:putative AAA+ superfamily ATPase [Algoriphagus sp. 4150]|nr:putative AAA+ superfamily ATPase [Algoriphagus sp. 4150]
MVKNRQILPLLQEYLLIFPTIGPLGPRQVGKTTLVKNLNLDKDSIYIDLEKASDRAKLMDVELFIKAFWFS